MFDKFVVQAVRKCLLTMEEKYQCRVILAGFVGSRIIGLHNDSSDYDIRAIALFTYGMQDKIFESFPFGTIKIEIMIFPFERVTMEIEEWSKLMKSYPTIVSDCSSRLIHEDIFRAQFRLTARCPFLIDKKFLSTHIPIVQKGLEIKDQLDYDYSRAYMNLKQFLTANTVNVRKYLYTINELLSIRWGLWKQTFPPDFLTLCQYFPIPDKLNMDLNCMVKRNRKSQDKARLFIARMDNLNFWLWEELKVLEKEIYIFSQNNGSISYLTYTKLLEK